MKYYKNHTGIKGVEVNLVGQGVNVGNDPEPANSGDTGEYNFPYVTKVDVSAWENDHYHLSPHKFAYTGSNSNYFDGLSALDASRIIRYSIQNLPEALINDEEMFLRAANVDLDYYCSDDNNNYSFCPSNSTT